MCREGYFLFLKKKIWASKFFYRTSDLLFHLSCGQVEIFLICQPLQEHDTKLIKVGLLISEVQLKTSVCGLWGPIIVRNLFHFGIFIFWLIKLSFQCFYFVT